MAEMWFYTSEGKQMNPVPMEELKRLIGAGGLKPTDMVWKEGMPRWMRASSVKELFPDPTAALDHYFTQPGTAPTPGQAAGVPMATSTAVAKSGAGDEPPAQPEKKQRKSADDYDDLPRQRRRAASGSGGSMVGILIALFLGGAVLLGGLVVGVVILIVWNEPAPQQKQPQPAPGQLPMASDPKDVKPIGPVNPNTLVKGNQTVYQVRLNPNERQSKEFSFRQGGQYEIIVATQQKFGGADVDLYVQGKGPEFLALDAGPDPDCNVRFTPAYDGQYRVELHNCLNPGAHPMITNSTVTIRELKAPPPKDDPTKEPPLPKGVFAGAGVENLDGILPNQFKEIKLRVKANCKANVRLTSAPFEKFQLVILKENEDVEIAKAQREAHNPTVEFTRPVMEIVRVRVTNKGLNKAPADCGVFYDMGK